MGLKTSNFTPHQRDTLLSFKRATANRGEIADKDFGSVGALRHLERKGAIEHVRTEHGPRGGEFRILRLTDEGARLADYISVNGLQTIRGARF